MTWLNYLFPTSLRTQTGDFASFAANRRTYIIGFSKAANLSGRPTPHDFHKRLDRSFAEDTRKRVPVTGWREHFPVDGRPDDEICDKWMSFGQDQPRYAWNREVMRTYDAVKAIYALESAVRDSGAQLQTSGDGMVHGAHEVSLHMAIYMVGGFDAAYYEAHFLNDKARLQRLFTHAQLRGIVLGATVPTFWEMAQGLAATYRTCSALKTFCVAEGLPALGDITLETHVPNARRIRARIKKGRDALAPIRGMTQDSAIELFN